MTQSFPLNKNSKNYSKSFVNFSNSEKLILIIFSSVHIVFKERQISRGLSAILEVVLNIN